MQNLAEMEKTNEKNRHTSSLKAPEEVREVPVFLLKNSTNEFKSRPPS